MSLIFIKFHLDEPLMWPQVYDWLCVFNGKSFKNLFVLSLQQSHMDQEQMADTNKTDTGTTQGHGRDTHKQFSGNRSWYTCRTCQLSQAE